MPVLCAGRRVSDDGEWTEHGLEAWPAAPHPGTTGGATEGETFLRHCFCIWVLKSVMYV